RVQECVNARPIIEARQHAVVKVEVGPTEVGVELHVRLDGPVKIPIDRPVNEGWQVGESKTTVRFGPANRMESEVQTIIWPADPYPFVEVKFIEGGVHTIRIIKPVMLWVRVVRGVCVRDAGRLEQFVSDAAVVRHVGSRGV